MNIIEDEVIGELRYLTVEFDQTEIIVDGGVISQGAAQRYLAKERPDLKIKKCGSFKLNPQEHTVTMRVGVVNTTSKTFERVRESIGGEIVSHAGVYMKTKLLNPGYDEILLENKKLKEEIRRLKINTEKPNACSINEKANLPEKV